MNSKVEALLAEVKSGLAALYGVRLKGVYLYGSYARGEEDAESDVDVLVVLDDASRYGAEIDRTSELVSALSLKYGVSISRVFVPEREWREGETLFLGSVRHEAVPA